MNGEQQQLGISDFTTRLSKAGIQILDQDRPWPERRATYFLIGKPGRETDVLLSDEFIRDLPGTREYQAAVDSYAQAVANRIRCGSPSLFYCLSDAAISVNIHWPIQAAVYNGVASAWLLLHVTNAIDGSLARCCVDLNQSSFYSVRTTRTTFDDIRFSINGMRAALDGGSVSFYNPRSHPESYQKIDDVYQARQPKKPQSEIDRFLAGKSYMLGFKIPEAPGEVWVGDPWDAEYLGLSNKELSQSAYVMRARGLIDLDQSLYFARPSDQLLKVGWPIALQTSESADALREITPLSLPKKEDLLTVAKNLAAQGVQFALIVIDLDEFKEVNDTKGHTAGDACLERVVKAIGGVVGRKGKVYRWGGGDEFAVTLPDFSTEEASSTAERIRRAIEEAQAGGDVPVTASIGVCANDRLKDAAAEELLEAADKAMYSSKKNGKNRVTTWPI
jgi:diguanylate cyclase (GGDEF)-like protein